jgi:hypothetical protein
VSQHARRWTRRYRVIVAAVEYEEMGQDVDEESSVRTRELPGLAPRRRLATRPHLRLLTEPEAA